ncbi:hypothetical protein IWQ56_001448 [Coemansia nantahalensis]|uniref:Uncharacterized protein n=2 Tax=Coemansia TaxID=4863 RepID=A0ACC1LER6_9FUNG|nr:hypothetical protein IWQ57_004886 [Coemansia nantahalensis]KAJ2772283.1 hypothetical protein IWQ56_001448 [Coemansia nantahalensis]KAJ2806986.1 hypothetical protein H4R21_000656 [Coemansia helicoidea]
MTTALRVSVSGFYQAGLHYILPADGTIERLNQEMSPFLEAQHFTTIWDEDLPPTTPLSSLLAKPLFGKTNGGRLISVEAEQA